MSQTETISVQLQRRRKQLGLSLADAARRAGTSQPTFSRYERGWNRFEIQTLRKLAAALGCELVIRLSPRAPRGGKPLARDAVVKRLSRLFWDHRLCGRDFARHPVWVVERVLEYGDLEDLRAIRSLMGAASFLDAVGQARLSSAKTQNFWKQMLAMEGRKCTRAFSRDTVWNC
jgi:transcriptional regulator with XRE-family HTH domain